MKSETFELLTRHPRLSILPEDVRRELLSKGRPVRFEDGEYLFRKGWHHGEAYFLLRGTVELYRGPLRVATARDEDPMPRDLSGGGGWAVSRQHSARSVGNVLCWAIPRAALAAAMAAGCTELSAALADREGLCAELRRERDEARARVRREQERFDGLIAERDVLIEAERQKFEDEIVRVRRIRDEAIAGLKRERLMLRREADEVESQLELALGLRAEAEAAMQAALKLVRGGGRDPTVRWAGERPGAAHDVTGSGSREAR